MNAPVSNQALTIERSWLISNRYLLARRFVQLGILSLFLVGPLYGIWIIEGNLNSSLLLKVVPMSDPFLLSQTIFAGHIPELTALTGGTIVATIYFLLGGRVFCSWVCPVNPVTDLAYWLRRKFNLRKGWSPSSTLRYWLLAVILLASMLFGVLIWEYVNPVSMLHRGIISGMGMAWMILLMVFIFDLLIAPRGWCGHLCPTGAFYSLLGHFSPLSSSVCNNCGRCIDVCPTNVFSFSLNTQNMNNSL
jgi:ferredoxin-type protein NapH